MESVTQNISGKARFDKDEIMEKIHSELENINISGKASFRVKVGNKFGAKNDEKGIKAGKRYISQETPFRFYKESEAHDAARILGGKVEKE